MNTLTHHWDVMDEQVIIQGGIIKQKVVIKKRRYIDFIVSGFKLSELFGFQRKEMISLLGWGNLEYNLHLIEEFSKIAEPDLESGRSIIYGCPQCGDIGCGAITAQIVDIGDKIIWRDFGYENSYEEINFDTFRTLTPFEFSKKQYLTEFLNIQDEIVAELKA